jgi:hypothetical protein
MTDEYDLKTEKQFNRDKLGTAIPNRLLELLEVLQCSSKNDWYAALTMKILASVMRICGDLLSTTGQDEALPAAAWNARNLLELWIWTEYCAASRANAQRFHDDALRDAAGLTNALSKMCELHGLEDHGAEPRRTLEEMTFKEHGVQSIGTNYERVSAAAKKVGLDAKYAAYNSDLSKFAHPTALLVVGTMHQGEAVSALQVICTTMGVYCAGRCVMALERMVRQVA